MLLRENFTFYFESDDYGTANFPYQSQESSAPGPHSKTLVASVALWQVGEQSAKQVSNPFPFFLLHIFFRLEMDRPAQTSSAFTQPLNPSSSGSFPVASATHGALHEFSQNRHRDFWHLFPLAVASHFFRQNPSVACSVASAAVDPDGNGKTVHGEFVPHSDLSSRQREGSGYESLGRL